MAGEIKKGDEALSPRSDPVGLRSSSDRLAELRMLDESESDKQPDWFVIIADGVDWLTDFFRDRSRESAREAVEVGRGECLVGECWTGLEGRWVKSEMRRI